MLNLDNDNYFVVLALLIVSVITGFLLDFLQGKALVSVHDASFYLPGPTLFIGAILIYLAKDKYGGVIERNLEIVGIGLTTLGISWIGYSGYFAAGFPAWGITPGFWIAFLGSLIATSFLLITYGFYLFWKLGKNVGGDQE